jgi:Rod binding domain-containing protein
LTGPLSALPAVPDSALPRAVREGSAADRQSYRAALGFERMFVEQLLKSATGGKGFVEGPQGAAVDTALADAMVANGGFGLAAELHSQIRDRS